MSGCSSIGGDLIVFHLLGSANQTGFHGVGVGTVCHDFLALFEQAFHANTFLALGADSKLITSFLQPFHLVLGLFEMFFKGSTQFMGLGGLGHLWQSLGNLGLCAIQIL